jgi:large subunit ribosomal protein L3
MKIGLIGKKVGMTRIYGKDGTTVPVTVIHVAGNQVVQVKTKEKEGYSAVQLGYDEKKEKRCTKQLVCHFKKAGVSPKYRLRECRIDDGEVPATGTTFGAEVFEVGDFVDVIGTTIGRSFAGVVKRYRFKGQPASHGSMMHRRTGSIGCRLTPGRVWKNQKMPGHMGVDRRTTQNLEVIQSRPEDGVVLVKGCVPGHKNAYVFVRPAIKKQAAKKK